VAGCFILSPCRNNYGKIVKNEWKQTSKKHVGEIIREIIGQVKIKLTACKHLLNSMESTEGGRE